MKTSEKRKEKQLSAIERETIIRISDDDDLWDIVTCSPKYKKKFEKQGWKSTLVGGIWGYYSFSVPERCVTFRKLEKKKVSQATVDALKTARLARKSINSTSDCEVNNAKS